MQNQINFRNVVQAALFKCEISGQLSDGNWENTRPYDHWKIWCNANVNVNPLKVGRNFYPVKDNYCLTSKFLLDIIGQRMVNIANMAENNCTLEDINDFNDWTPAYNDYKGEYWDQKRARFIEAFGSVEGYKKAITGSYSVITLKAELKDMMKIMRTHI